MFDAKRLLDQFTGAGGMGSMLEGKKGLATGAVAGGLAAYLLAGKKPKKLAKTALKMGGLALIGGLAYKAWNDSRQGKAPGVGTSEAPIALPPPSDTGFLPTAASEQEAMGRALIRAMIAAAKADGHIDTEEQGRIFSRIGELQLDADDQAFVFRELSKPLDVNAVAEAATTPELAAEIYAASLLAIDVDGPAEKGYLAMLAARLGLSPELVAHLHANVAAVTEPA